MEQIAHCVIQQNMDPTVYIPWFMCYYNKTVLDEAAAQECAKEPIKGQTDVTIPWKEVTDCMTGNEKTIFDYILQDSQGVHFAPDIKVNGTSVRTSDDANYTNVKEFVCKKYPTLKACGSVFNV